MRACFLGPEGSRAALAFATCVLLHVAGCSGSKADDHTSDSAACDGRGQTLEGLHVEGSQGLSLDLVEHEPAALTVGNHRWVFELESGGQPLLGAAARISVTPYMPDHGHGTAISVQVLETTAGRYEFSPVNLRMPGYWEITVRVADDVGGGGGASEATFDEAKFGVCVP